MPPASAILERIDTTSIIFRLEGQWRLDTFGGLTRQMHDALDTHPDRQLVLRCNRLEFVDSQALAALLGLSRRCGERGRRVQLLDPPAMLVNLLQLTRLDVMFEVVRTGDNGARIAR